VTNTVHIRAFVGIIVLDESRVCCSLFPEIFIRHYKTARQFLDCVAVNVINEVLHLAKYKMTLLQS